MLSYEAEVEYFNASNDEQDNLKSVIWADEDFTEYLKDVGLEEALYQVTDFHRNVANQCKDRGAHLTMHDDTPTGHWSRRAISLTMQLKKRRQQLKKAIRDNYDDGWDRVDKITREVEDDWS